MQLEIFLPFGVFDLVTDVLTITAETKTGSFGILPHRLDCVAALAPGILAYTTRSGSVFLAADEGVLTKRGADVTVSVRHCIRGTSLSVLHDEVQRAFLTMSRQDLAMRNAITKMENGFLGQLTQFQHER